MSKRTGKAITLVDLLDDVPVDSARFVFNQREPGAQILFDLDLAVRQDSDNPVYYVQYAHARICSILRALQEEGVTPAPIDTVDLALLQEESEIAVPAYRLFPRRDRDRGQKLRPGAHHPVCHRPCDAVPQVLHRLPRKGRGRAAVASAPCTLHRRQKHAEKRPVDAENHRAGQNVTYLI